jgi:hypothetical protein
VPYPTIEQGFVMKRVAGVLFAILLSSHAGAETKPFQQGFIDVVKDYAAQYEQAPNELKKSALVKKRLEAISKLPGKSNKVDGWYGTVEKMGTTGDGDAYLIIHPMTDDMTLGTWNNSFSDTGSKTLIKSGSPLYDAIAELEEDDLVVFSGAIGKPKNMTENGTMTDPDFLFKFTKVQKVQ